MKKILLIISLLLIPSVSFASTYGANFLTAGTASADANVAGQVPADALDGVNTVANAWESGNTAYEHWWKYDLGVGITKAFGRLEISAYGDANGLYIKDVTIEGSNNDSDYTFIATSTSPNQTTDSVWHYFNLATTSAHSAYRYYKLRFNNAWNVTNTDTVVDELLMKECETGCFPVAATGTTMRVIWWE